MKRPYLILISIMLTLASSSQTLVSFGDFPPNYNDTASLKTSDLLAKINWQVLKKFCDTAKGHYVYERKNGALTTFSYVKQGYEASFDITSYKDFVLEFYSDMPNSTKPVSSSYFDKKLWLQYVNEQLPDIGKAFQIGITEPKTVLKSYYELLGVNTRDEYGWICEYSTVGSATGRRIAIIELLKNGRIDLIKKLLDYPNIQTQLYAVDAIIYNNNETKTRIAEYQNKIKIQQKKIDSLTKVTNADKEEIDYLKYQIKSDKDFVNYLEKQLLSKDEWQSIYKLRDSKKTVLTCGNSGSYKIYETPIADLLSDKAIADIPKQYEGLKTLGYFH